MSDDESELQHFIGPDREVIRDIPDPKIIPIDWHERARLGWYGPYRCGSDPDEGDDALPPLTPEEVRAFQEFLHKRKGLPAPE